MHSKPLFILPIACRRLPLPARMEQLQRKYHSIKYVVEFHSIQLCNQRVKIISGCGIVFNEKWYSTAEYILIEH